MLNAEKYPALAAMLAVASQDVRTDFARLIATEVSDSPAHKAVHAVGAVLAEHGMLNGFAKLATPSAKPEMKTTTQPAEDGFNPATEWEISDPDILLQLHLLAACAAKGLPAFYQKAGKELGKPEGERNRYFGGLLAYIKNRGRAAFVGKLMVATPKGYRSDVIKQVAEFYKAGGIQTSPHKLRAEARNAGFPV